MEYVDIINREDQVIGKASKDECHARGLLHRGSGVFVFSDATYRQLLLQRRSQRVRHGGTWCHLGGHVMTGETYETAARREFYEELYRITKLPAQIPYTFERLFRILKEEPEDREFITVYRVIASGPFSPDPTEVAEVQFCNVEKIVKDIPVHQERYTAAFRSLFQKYRTDFM